MLTKSGSGSNLFDQDDDEGLPDVNEEVEAEAELDADDDGGLLHWGGDEPEDLDADGCLHWGGDEDDDMAMVEEEQEDDLAGLGQDDPTSAEAEAEALPLAARPNLELNFDLGSKKSVAGLEAKLRIMFRDAAQTPATRAVVAAAVAVATMAVIDASDTAADAGASEDEGLELQLANASACISVFDSAVDTERLLKRADPTANAEEDEEARGSVRPRAVRFAAHDLSSVAPPVDTQKDSQSLNLEAIEALDRTLTGTGERRMRPRTTAATHHSGHARLQHTILFYL